MASTAPVVLGLFIVEASRSLTCNNSTKFHQKYFFTSEFPCRVSRTNKILRRIFGAIKVNENWRKRHNKELKQVFGDLDILSFVRISRLKWIGHVNRMENKRTVSQVFNNNPQESRPRGRPRNRCWNCVQTDIKKCKINNWKER
jgi:hypothetical protein